MDERIKRFTLCDVRFYPYLDQVLERTPTEVKEDVLGNTGFQILADPGMGDSCTLHYSCARPMEYLVFINPNALRRAEYQIVYAIARELAFYRCSASDREPAEEQIERLLLDWGFEPEIRAVAHEKKVTASQSYKIGYEWAKKQSREYLMQHFGLFLEEWITAGTRKMADLGRRAAEARIDVNSMVMPGAEDAASEAEAFSARDAITAGIMEAIREMSMPEIVCR